MVTVLPLLYIPNVSQPSNLIIYLVFMNESHVVLSDYDNFPIFLSERRKVKSVNYKEHLKAAPLEMTSTPIHQRPRHGRLLPLLPLEHQ